MSFETGQPSPIENKRDTSKIIWNGLKQMGAAIERDMHGEADAFFIKFSSGGAVTTIRIVFNDSTGADMVITNVTTLPDDKKGQGFGSDAIQKLLKWTGENKIVSIRAVQVQRQSENFWQKNGFSKIQDPNPTNDFMYGK